MQKRSVIKVKIKIVFVKIDGKIIIYKIDCSTKEKDRKISKKVKIEDVTYIFDIRIIKKTEKIQKR